MPRDPPVTRACLPLSDMASSSVPRRSPRCRGRCPLPLRISSSRPVLSRFHPYSGGHVPRQAPRLLGGRQGDTVRAGVHSSTMSFVSHVECTICGASHDAKRLLTVCEKCGQMLAVRYDLARVAASVTKDALHQRAPCMYRFRELTPLDDAELPVTLGEGGTPLLELPRLAAHFGIKKRSEEHTSELQSPCHLVCRL